MNSTFNPFIVLLSILVAVYVSYIVVGVCLRIAVSRSKAAYIWTVCGSISMGMGIWSMHFIGMLAFRLPIPVYYDIALTAFSIVPAIIASFIALFVVQRRGGWLQFSVVTLFIGLGISAMHYTGMAAMHMTPDIEYKPPIVMLSILIAIAASGAALLLLSFQIRQNRVNPKFKLLSALIMGLAVTGMHYVGMFAVVIPADCVSDPTGGINLDRDVLLVIVTIIVVTALFLTQMATILDKAISEKSFYQAVFDAHANMGEGLLVVEQNEFVDTNQLFRDMFTIPNRPLTTLKDFRYCFTSGDFARFLLWVNNYRTKSSQVVKEHFQLKDDNLKRTIEVALTCFVYLDKVRHLLVFTDITDKKNAEESIKTLNESLELRVEERTLELKHANLELNQSMKSLKEAQSELVHSQKMASLGSLVAGISHEINTPIGIGVTAASNMDEELTAITNKLADGTMKKSDLDEFFHHTQESTTILMKNLKRASDLIASFKQVAVDQSSDSSRTINLHNYINEAILSIKPQLSKTQIVVSNTIDTTIDIYTNPGALYQVFVNLIQNSLIHGFNAQQPGKITISGNRVRNHIQLNYRDTGVGISEEIQTKIFDPFFTTRMGEGGSGLGLSIVYNLVKTTLNGTIEVIDEEWSGAHFEITLPIISEETNNA
ncbi:hypothetical protein DBZ36_05860 [Alginatibacterium sediminis]|uniref:histidine kinase n=1 Tax=Alginatibacterium sediminis TaxID=2164068 RepID=A0A420EGY5_9ALTE|nr:MHYT domain-containing protein [Alginatibacterium sediminis]RKF19975.1 hypothetical protein DBZ36_05860 [Alginatibacterium sediminis]